MNEKERIQQNFATILYHITTSEIQEDPLTKIDLADHFQPQENSEQAIARNLNAAFLILLSGKEHPAYQEAKSYMQRFEQHDAWKDLVIFYQDGITRIHNEFVKACQSSREFTEDFNTLYLWLSASENRARHEETIQRIWKVFFPEGVGIQKEKAQYMQALRNKRTIRISRLNPDPITYPAREMLFTSNVLLTLPLTSQHIDDLRLSAPLREQLKQISGEKQVYWYDHPVHIGVEPQHNEVIYGLQGLQQALEFEQQRGNAAPDDKLTCVLSVSVTHNGLHTIAGPYLEEELNVRNKGLSRQLDVFVFTEDDTRRLVNDILLPAAQRYVATSDADLLPGVFGVDGEYGRHYTFLKAISAFWQVFINPALKATFKIDLDQVFPQDDLVRESGASAFEHFCTPLWGAEGVDHQDRVVELGMLAGALVNEKDIAHSLFTPDVTFPTGDIAGEQVVFFSRVPQALSTEAMMIARYDNNSLLDGVQRCLQRIHVTGGTNGILVRSLRKYRPFTPSFIGRAEDQAYLLSALFKGTQKYLRYVHKDGLIMRHDKEAFAVEAIRAARLGTNVGDLARMLWFTLYARALPWDLDQIKDDIDPFTGAFVSRIPITIVYLRLALQAAALFEADSRQNSLQGCEFVIMGAERLHKVIRRLSGGSNPLIEQYQREQQGWEVYYDILEAVERALRRNDDFALELQEKATCLVRDCQMHFGN